jgi:hypothetical protein
MLLIIPNNPVPRLYKTLVRQLFCLQKCSHFNITSPEWPIKQPQRVISRPPPNRVAVNPNTIRHSLIGSRVETLNNHPLDSNPLSWRRYEALKKN